MSDARCFKFDVSDMEVDDLPLAPVGFDEAVTTAVLAHNLFWEWLNNEFTNAIKKSHDTALAEGTRYAYSKKADTLAPVMRQYRRYMNQVVKDTDLEVNLWEHPRKK